MKNNAFDISKIQENKYHMAIMCSLVIVVCVITGWIATQDIKHIILFISGLFMLAILLYSYVRPIKIENIQKILLYITIIAGFIGPAFLIFPFGPIHIFPYRILLPLLWFVLVIQILVSRGKLAISHIKARPYLQFLGLWLAYAILSMSWAFSKGDAVKDIIFLFMSVSVIFFTVYYLNDYKDIDRLYRLWFIVFGALLILGIWEHLTWQHLPVSGYYLESRPYLQYLPTGVFHNPNDYATYLALSIPFAVGLVRYTKSIFIRLIGLVTIVTAFYFVVIVGSRANILAVLLEIAFFVLFMTNIKQKFKLIIILIMCSAVVLLFLPGPLQLFFSKLGGELMSLSGSAGLRSGSVGIRINLIRNGLMFLYSTFGFGVGAGNAEYWMSNFPIYNTLGILNPHNWWLEILVNYGILLFFGYIAMYIGIMKNLFHIWRKASNHKERMIAESLLLSLIGFLFASISSSSIMAFNPQWLLFAFALAFLNMKRNRMV